MSLYAKVCQRWIASAVEGQTVRSLKCERVFYRGDSIFSYGRHFSMARVLRDENNEPRLILVNGDTFSVTTTRHQSILRNELSTVELPKAIIPFSALVAAGIDLDTVEPLQITEDTYETVTVRTTRDKLRADPILRTVEGTDVWVYDDGSVATDDDGRPCRKWGWNNAIVTVENPDHRYDWRHEDGTIASYNAEGSTFRMATGHNSSDDCEKRWHEDARGNRVTYIPQELERTGGYRYYSPRSKHGEWTHVEGDLFERNRYIHHLGESLIKAKYRTRESEIREALFLSGFDENESRPAYFFCQLPETSTATTVAEAREDLKTSTVRLAEQMGRTVLRQGDVYHVGMEAISKRDLRRMGATFERHAFILGTNHRATEVAVLPDGTTFARGTLTHAPEFRRPDHRRVTVGKRFGLVMRNTVPTA